MQKKWFVVGGVVLATLGGGAVLASRGKDKAVKPGASENLPFRVGKVSTDDLLVSVREVGVVDPETKVDVKSTVSGRLVSIAVREGAMVKKGDVLAEVEPDVNQAQTLSDVQAGVTSAVLRLKDAERELHAQQKLADAGLIGMETLKDFMAKRDLAAEGVNAAKTRYQIVEDRGIPISGNSTTQKARVTAPMSGVVITKGVELGETVTSGVSSFNAGTVMFTVADLKTLLIRVNVNEVDIAKIATEQRVRVTLDAYPQKVFTGKVRFVAPAAKIVDKIKVFEVEVALDELTDAFRTGMSANVEILGQEKKAATSVPLEALQRKDGQVLVYKLKSGLTPQQIEKAKTGLSGRTKFIWLSDNWKDYFEATPVSAGIATLERVEILSGVKSGDQVALEDPTKKKVEKDDEDN